MLCDDSSPTALGTSLVFRLFVSHRLSRQLKPTVLEASLEEVPRAVWTRVDQHQAPHAATAHSHKSQLQSLSNTQLHQSTQTLQWLKLPIRGGKRGLKLQGENDSSFSKSQRSKSRATDLCLLTAKRGSSQRHGETLQKGLK